MPLKVNPNVLFTNITFFNFPIVDLNKKNSDEAKKAISQDLRFKMDLENKIYDYHCMLHEGEFPYGLPSAVLDVVTIIDIVNSTQKYRSNQVDVLKRIADYIAWGSTLFKRRLCAADKSLVDDMVNYVFGLTGRTERSLCSKVCRFFSNKLFPKKDTFYAWDTIVRNALPDYYAAYFGNPLNNTKWTTYKDFHSDIEDLRVNFCSNLSRLELDHLLWFCHK